MAFSDENELARGGRHFRGNDTPKPLFCFDVSRYVLTNAHGETIRLRPQSLDVFVLLLKHANEVVSKEDILSVVWKGIAVTDDSVTQCIGDTRRVLGQEHRSLLHTVPRLGYRMCLGVDEAGDPVIAPYGFQALVMRDPPIVERQATVPDDIVSDAGLDSQFKQPYWVPIVCAVCLLAFILVIGVGKKRQDRDLQSGSLSPNSPTLAVLPFESIGTASGKSYFSDGITEDIIALLSRFSELGMVSWSTISSHSSGSGYIKSVAEEYGVRYLISGSVRHENDRVRVAVRLTDATDARLLWSERYDEPLQDVFLVQDRIARQIVTTMAVKLTQFETTLSQNIPTNNIEAYQLSLLGRSELRKRTREGNLAARERFAEAIDLDPGYADAYIRLGETYLEQALFGWAEWPERSTDKALLLANAAVELGGADARSLGFLARLHVRTGENDRAQTYLDRAFAFNANDPSLHEIQGLLHLWNGMADEAIDHLEYVRRYDPDSTFASSHLSTAYYVAGMPADAVATIERLIENAPYAAFIHVILTAALVESDRLESAKAAAAVVRRQQPFLTAAGASRIEFFANDEIRVRFITSLRRAGLD